MKIRKWTIALLILIVLDSIFTVYIGEEANGLILRIMNILNLSLTSAMVLRVFYSLPFLYILNIKEGISKLVFLSYIGIYITMGGVILI